MRFFVASFVLTLACSGDDVGPTDAGGRRDSAIDCPAGEHLCGIVCMTDVENEPRNGCRLGCGVPCPVPTGGEARCLSEGRCDVTCAPPYVRSGDTCRCVPPTCSSMGVQCGDVDDGCGGTMSCGMCGTGRECIDGQCECELDDAEPNDDELRAFRLGTFPDEPDSTMTFDTYSIHAEDDVDFYRARIVDAAMSNPTIRVTLTGLPTGHDYDVTAWFTCDAAGMNTTRCDAGMSDMEFGVGCIDDAMDGMARVQLQTFCTTTDESGTLLIRIRPKTWTDACMPYDLLLEVT